MVRRVGANGACTTLQRRGDIAEAAALFHEVRTWAERPDARQPGRRSSSLLAEARTHGACWASECWPPSEAIFPGEHLLLAAVNRAELEHDNVTVATALHQLGAVTR